MRSRNAAITPPRLALPPHPTSHLRAARCTSHHLTPPPQAIAGKFLKLPDETKLHLECKEPYLASKAEPCIQCKGPIARIEGKFDGQFYNVDSGKVHNECWDNYVKDHPEEA